MAAVVEWARQEKLVVVKEQPKMKGCSFLEEVEEARPPEVQSAEVVVAAVVVCFALFAAPRRKPF